MAVILLHICSVAIILYGDGISDSAYIITDALQYILSFGVPCFVMVSGSLLLNPGKEIPLSRLYKRYILKFLIALGVSVMIFRIFTMIMDGEPPSIGAFTTGLIQIVTGESWAHLWYIYMMLGIYILLPLFKGFIKASEDNALKYILVILFIFNSALPLLSVFDFEIGFFIQIATIFPFYFLLGYALHSRIINLRLSLSIIMFVLGVVLMALVCGFNFYYELPILDQLITYSSPITVLLSMGLFGIFQNAGGERVNAFVSALDNSTFWIYLFHLIPVRLLLRYLAFNPYSYGYLTPLVFAGLLAVVLFSTWGVVAIVKILIRLMFFFK